MFRISWARSVMISFFLKSRRIRNILKRIWVRYASEIKSGGAVVTEVAEILPLTARAGLPPKNGKTRINLLVPALSEMHVFGGIATALSIFEEVQHAFDEARIIVTDEANPRPRLSAFYGNWPIVSMSDDLTDGNHIVPSGSRWGETLSLSDRDYFMVTSWWTAHLAFSLLQQQEILFPCLSGRKLLYLIQDYEPGFYPWSARYALAQATYCQGSRTLALVNSHELLRFLRKKGLTFSAEEYFAPLLHPRLAAFRSGLVKKTAKQLMLIYSRPGVERNAFPLVVAVLRQWVSQYDKAVQWDIVGVGEPFPEVRLGGGCSLRSLGKLEIEDYARMLADASVGFSLMISPHPSYPPLEMAAFGVEVLTNAFDGKDLSGFSRFIHSARDLSIEGLSASLTQLTRDFDKNRCQAEREGFDHAAVSSDYLRDEVLAQSQMTRLTNALRAS